MKKKITWIFNRWKIIDHPFEDFYRLKQVLQLLICDRFSAIFFKKKKCFQFTNNYNINIKSLEKLWTSNFNCKKFKFYDLVIDDIFKIKNWRLDLKNNISSEIRFCNSIKSQNFNKNGDIRYIATLSRLQFLPYLVSESILYKDKKQLDNVYHLLLNWYNDNPYLKSINWKSGIEISIRSLNLDLSRALLDRFPEKNQSIKDLKKLIDEIQYLNYRFLKNHLSYYSSANNHLLYELIGLFYLTSSYDFQNSKYWTKRASDELRLELIKQTYEDGFTKEQATHYHAEVVNIFCMYFSRAQAISLDFTKSVIDRFQKMFEVLQLFIKDDNNLWNIGDSDDGEIIYPYFDMNYNLYDSIYKSYGAFFLSEFENDLRTIFYQPKKILRFCTNFNSKAKSYSNITKSGYYIFKDKKTHIVFDIGKIGYGALAAHGHADILQILLRNNDEDILVDPGTYQYNSKHEKWRNYFKGTLSHNTISVNGLDQSKSGGRMMWINKPVIDLNSYIENMDTTEVKATHNGFSQQRLNVLHTRKIKFHKNSKKLIIEDFLSAPKNKKYSIVFSLNFGNLELKIKDEKVFLLSKKNKVTISNEFFNSAHIYNSNISKPSGWMSNKFDHKMGINKLELALDLRGEFSMLTKIRF